MSINLSEASFDAELKTVFLNEAEEMLDDTERAFIEIEENPQDIGKVDKIFRLVHTIKGSAHVAGFPQLGNFAHVFESLLGELREGKIAINSVIIDVLLSGNDRFRKFIDALRLSSTATIDVSDIEAKIRKILPGVHSPAAHQKPAEPPKPVPKTLSELLPKKEASKTLKPAVIEPSKQFPEEKAEKQKLTVLVCDDEADPLALLQEVLEEGGYSVIACSSATAALVAMESNRIDIVLTDFSMPDMDGIQLVRKIREFNQFIEIIIISGRSSRSYFKTFLEIGVDEFVDKPFTSEELLFVMQRIEKSYALRQSLLSMTRLTFRASVAMEKIKSGFSDKNMLPEWERCSEIVGEMRDVTRRLLDAERANKRTLPGK